MLKKVLIMDPVSKKMEEFSRLYLEDEIEVIFCKNDEDRKKYIQMADVLVTFTKGISAEWIKQAHNCKFIQKLGAGVNNIDIEEASKRNIPVANTVGLNATSVAEHTVMLMLSVFKHVVTAHTAITNESRWLKTELRDNSYQLSYKKVGLIGFGNIGSEVSKLLNGFQCEVSYYDVRRISEEQEKENGIKFKELDEIIKDSDVISLHVPLNNKTKHLLNEKRLSQMKSTAILVNTCRGGIIDENALYQVLKAEKLVGAGLDVFEQEPIDKYHQLATLSNVIMTPHIAGGTNEAMKAVAFQAYTNINEFLKNEELHHKKSIVNINEIDVSS